MSNRAVGIDLGTTYSAIAQVNKHGVPEILANAEGDRITPSVVLFDNDDIVVGNYAKQAAVAYPDQVVDFVKRYMGDPDYGFAYRTEVYTPEKLSSFILASSWTRSSTYATDDSGGKVVPSCKAQNSLQLRIVKGRGLPT